MVYARPRGCLPRHFVGTHRPLRAIKRLLRKHLDVCLPRRVVGDGIVVRPLCLGRLEALDQRARKVEAVIVGCMEGLVHDLVDGVVLAPVGEGGLDTAELVCAVDEAADLGDLERRREWLGHGDTVRLFERVIWGALTVL